MTDREYNNLHEGIDRIEHKLDKHIEESGPIQFKLATLQAEMAFVKKVGGTAVALLGTGLVALAVHYITNGS